MRLLFLIFFSLSSVLSVLAQQVSIKEVLDANLFKLSDGRIVKLAGVDAPSDSSSIPFLRIVSGLAKEYISGYKNSRLQMDSVSVDKNNRYCLVILYKKYAFQNMCLNENFLASGFGKFINNVEPFDSSELVKAQETAIKHEDGIWRFYTPTKNDTLDCTLTNSGIAYIINPDSTKLNNSYNQTSVVGKITIELLAGSGATFVSTLAGVGAVSLFNPNNGWAALGGGMIGLGVGYFIGFPTMIYLIAKGENPNLNFWENLGCSWGLTLVNGLIASQIKEHNHPMHAIAWLSPVIGSLVYAHILAPQGPSTNSYLLAPDKKNSSFKDFRESQTTQVELFRINF